MSMSTGCAPIENKDFNKSLMVNSDSRFSLLFNKKIFDIEINEDKNWLRFSLEDNKFLYLFAEADCCSDSWFEQFVNLPHKSEFIIIDFKGVGNFPAPPTKQEVDIIHYFEMTYCNKFYKSQSTTFCLRNSSNGYYDGWPIALDSFPTWTATKEHKEEKWISLYDN